MSETLYLILRSVKIRYAFKLAVAMPSNWLLQCLQVGCCYAFKYAVAMIVCCRRVHIMFNLYRTHVRTLLSAILYLIYLVLQYWISVSGEGFRWNVVGKMTGWLGSSVVDCSHGKRKNLGSSPGRATILHLLQIASNDSTMTCYGLFGIVWKEFIRLVVWLYWLI